jgi:hypothetical protein
VKLARGERWTAYLELHLFLEHIVVLAFNALDGMPWYGPRGIDTRFSPETVAALEAARPKSLDADELRRAVRASAELCAEAREELKARLDPALPDELMRQVLARLRGAPATPD